MMAIDYNPDARAWEVRDSQGAVIFTGTLMEAQRFMYDNDPSAR